MLTVDQLAAILAVLEVRNRPQGTLAPLIAAVREGVATHPDYNPNPTTVGPQTTTTQGVGA